MNNSNQKRKAIILTEILDARHQVKAGNSADSHFELLQMMVERTFNAHGDDLDAMLNDAGEQS